MVGGHGIDHSSMICPEYTALCCDSFGTSFVSFGGGRFRAGLHTLYSLLTASEHGVLGTKQYYEFGLDA
jgi:hypothetical protein